MVDRRQDATVPLVGDKIIILDPRRLSREALHRLLESASLAVIGEGKTLTDALQHMPPETKPDLIIHNFDTDDEAEEELPRIQEARTRFKGVKSVVLTDCIRTEVVLQVAKAGIEAILSKDISANVLQRSIELVLLGQHMFPTGLAQSLLEPARSAPKSDNGPPAPSLGLDRRRATALSQREHQILRCLVDGLSNKVIARELDITEATVKVHIKGLLRKTQMTNRTQAAIWALSNSLWTEPVAVRTGISPQPGPADHFFEKLRPAQAALEEVDVALPSLGMPR
jgi:two-component system, NarL family, nitrate/nitrite response regulator NarL